MGKKSLPSLKNLTLKLQHKTCLTQRNPIQGWPKAEAHHALQQLLIVRPSKQRTIQELPYKQTKDSSYQTLYA